MLGLAWLGFADSSQVMKRKQKKKKVEADASLDRVLDKRHREAIKKCVFPVEEAHLSSGKLLNTKGGNEFFYFLAKLVEQFHPTTGGAAAGARHKPERRTRVMKSNIKLTVPATCLPQKHQGKGNGKGKAGKDFSLLYTNERSGCLELKTGLRRKGLLKNFLAERAKSIAASESCEAIAVLKHQESWNTSQSMPIGKKELEQVIAGLESEAKPPSPSRLEAATTLTGAIVAEIVNDMLGKMSVCGDGVDSYQDQGLPSSASGKNDAILQDYVRCKGPTSTLYRVLWRSSSSSDQKSVAGRQSSDARNGLQVPLKCKVWKFSSLINANQQPLVDIYSPKACSVQDVSGKTFVDDAVKETASFATSLGLLVNRMNRMNAEKRGGPTKVKLTELVLDFVLSENHVWHVVQLKAFKCVEACAPLKHDGLIQSKGTLGRKLSWSGKAGSNRRPQSARQAGSQGFGGGYSKCDGDYCGALSSRENPSGENNVLPKSTYVVESNRKRVLNVKPFAAFAHNTKEAFKSEKNAMFCLSKQRAFKDLKILSEEDQPREVLFKIPYKLVLNDRSNAYHKSDTLIKWLYRMDPLEEARHAMVDPFREEWETFNEVESMLIEDAFQKGCKFYSLSDRTSISFVDEKMECELVHATTGRRSADSNLATYDIKRHPPFVTQQYIVDRSNNASAATQSNSLGSQDLLSESKCDLLGSPPAAAQKSIRCREKNKLYDMVSVCRDCYRVYLCKEHMKLQGMLRQ